MSLLLRDSLIPVMVVPKKLVPAVRELIAREHQGNNKE